MPSQGLTTFKAKQNSPARKQAYCKPTRTQTFFMSRSADSSTRRTKNEIQIRRIAAMMIEAQNIIQPAYMKIDGDGLPRQLRPEAYANDCLQTDQPLAPIREQL